MGRPTLITGWTVEQSQASPQCERDIWRSLGDPESPKWGTNERFEFRFFRFHSDDDGIGGIGSGTGLRCTALHCAAHSTDRSTRPLSGELVVERHGMLVVVSSALVILIHITRPLF